MEAQFWHARWREGRTAWDQATPHRFLPRHWSALGCQPDGSVFVPLCGTSVDMVWLASNGHRVIGNELSEHAVDEFLRAVDAPVDRRAEPPFAVSEAGSYELWAGDVLDLPAPVVAAVDAVYDRASLVALEPGLRRRYADHLTEIVPHGAPIFLISFEYDTSEMEGPPFSVAADEIRELFSAFDAEVIAADDAVAANSDLGGRGLTALVETLTVLRR